MAAVHTAHPVMQAVHTPLEDKKVPDAQLQVATESVPVHATQVPELSLKLAAHPVQVVAVPVQFTQGDVHAGQVRTEADEVEE